MAYFVTVFFILIGMYARAEFSSCSDIRDELKNLSEERSEVMSVDCLNPSNGLDCGEKRRLLDVIDKQVVFENWKLQSYGCATDFNKRSVKQNL